MPGAKPDTALSGAPPPFGKAAAGALGFAGLGLVFFFLIIGAVGLPVAVAGLFVWVVGAIAVWRVTKISAGPNPAGEDAP